MRGRNLFLRALLLSALSLGAQQVPSTVSSVDDLVRVGIGNNKDLASMRQRVAESQGMARQAAVRPSPTLGMSGATGKPLGTIGEEQYGAELSQSIEMFGKRGKRIRAADVAVAVSESEYQEKAAELAYQIRAAYAELSAERHKLKLLSDLIGFNQDTLRLTEARVKEGDLAPLEASLLKVEISRAAVSQKTAAGRLKSAELELRRLTGLGEGAALPDSDMPAPPQITLDKLKQEALANRADLKAARLEEQRQAAETELARAEAKPDLTVSAGYTRQNSQFDGLYGFNSSGELSPIRDRVDILSFGVSIPLRTTRSGAGNIQAAVARTVGARLSREYLESKIPLEVEDAYQRWTTATQSLQMLESGVVGPSTANLSVIREAYKLGQLRLLDVLNEQRRLVDTELSYIDAQADAARSWAELQRAVGGIQP